MHFKTPSRPAQVAGAHFTMRPVAVASANSCFASPFAPLTTARGALASPGAFAGPTCGQSGAAHKGWRFYAPVPDLPRLLSHARSAGSRETMQRNGKQEEDYPYELQLQLFGRHLLSLAEEASRFDFRGTYSAVEVAELLQVTPSKIYELLHTKELPSIKVGKQFRVGKFSLWAYINGLEREGLVEDILQRFVTQHCCRDGECIPIGGQR